MNKIIQLIGIFFLFSHVYADIISEVAYSQKWLHLLHMEKTVYKGFQSRVSSDSQFFLSSEGFRNPLEELQTTIKYFENQEKLTLERGHINCLYPARLNFLKKYFPNLKITNIRCDGLEQWKKEIRGDDIQIVFATQFLSNPASVMGHTFIKVVDENAPDYLNYTIGYAASVDESVEAIEYAYNGLFGGFKGNFTVAPYYEKVQEYNNIERRDIWEFTLNLTSEQRDEFLNILWELKFNADFQYYFMSENCSYLSIAILQIIFPDYLLIDDLSFYVAPLSTIKVLDKYELIKSTSYRPSIRKKLRRKFESLDAEGKSNVVDAVRTKKFTGNDASVFDTLLDYVYLKKYLNKGELSQEWSTFKEELLVSRSKITSDTIEMEKEASKNSILNTHGTFFLEIGHSWYENAGFEFIRFSPGAHRYMDDSLSFARNNSFSFFDIEIVHNRDNKRLYVNNFKLFDIKSFTPTFSIDEILSWGTSLSMRRLTDSNEKKYEYLLDFELGYEKDVLRKIYHHWLLLGRINTKNQYIDTVDLSFGAKYGLGLQNEKQKIELENLSQYSLIGKYLVFETNFKYRQYNIYKSFDLNLMISRHHNLTKSFEIYRSEIGLVYTW